MGYIFRKIRPKLTPENHPFRRRLRQPLWPDPRCSDDRRMIVAAIMAEERGRWISDTPRGLDACRQDLAACEL